MTRCSCFYERARSTELKNCSNHGSYWFYGSTSTLTALLLLLSMVYEYSHNLSCLQLKCAWPKSLHFAFTQQQMRWHFLNPPPWSFLSFFSFCSVSSRSCENRHPKRKRFLYKGGLAVLYWDLSPESFTMVYTQHHVMTWTIHTPLTMQITANHH